MTTNNYSNNSCNKYYGYKLIKVNPKQDQANTLAGLILEENLKKGKIIEIPSLKIKLKL